MLLNKSKEQKLIDIKTRAAASLANAKAGILMCSTMEETEKGTPIENHIFAEDTELLMILGEGLLDIKRRHPMLWKPLIIALSERGAFEEFKS